LVLRLIVVVIVVRKEPVMAARTAERVTDRDDEETAGPGSGGNGPERVTVNLSARAARALQIATDLTGESKTDAINRALQIYAFLEKIADHGGAVYARETPDAELERLKIF
jgi:hypothetical protein